MNNTPQTSNPTLDKENIIVQIQGLRKELKELSFNKESVFGPYPPVLKRRKYKNIIFWDNTFNKEPLSRNLRKCLSSAIDMRVEEINVQIGKLQEQL